MNFSLIQLSSSPACNTFSLTSGLDSNTLTQNIINRVSRILDSYQIQNSFPLPFDFSPADSNSSTFLGVDWENLGQYVTQYGLVMSLPKIIQTFWNVIVNLNQAEAKGPFAMIQLTEKLLPGAISHAWKCAIKKGELKSELIDKHARFHLANIKYTLMTQNLTPTDETCRRVFEELAIKKGYQELCFNSFKEIYTFYSQVQEYHSLMFVTSYFERIENFIPLFKGYLPTKESQIENEQKQGLINPKLTDIDLTNLSAKDLIVLFEEKCGTPHTLILSQQTTKLEICSHKYDLLGLEDKVFDLCLLTATRISEVALKNVKEEQNIMFNVK